MELKSFMMVNITPSTNTGCKSAGGVVDYNERTEEVDKLDYMERKEIDRINDANYGNDLAHVEAVGMPKWAEQAALKNGTSVAKEFFLNSAKHERKNGTHYIEVKIALPLELTLEQNIALIKDTMNKVNTDGRPWSMAIHDKVGELGEGKRNPHVHILFSERKKDEIEKDNPKQYFMRYNSKEPKKGGCQKDDRFSKKGQINRDNELKNVRKLVAETINEHYFKNNLPFCVDHRTKDEQFMDAYKKGDYDLAEILAVDVQKHLGSAKAENLNHPDTKRVLELKQETQAIKDRQLLDNSRKEEDIVQFPPNMSPEERLAILDKHAKDVMNRISVTQEKIEKGYAESKTPLKKAHSIDEFTRMIDVNTNKLSINIHNSALRSFMKTEGKLNEYVDHQSNLNNLQWNNKQKETKEKLLKQKLENNRTVTAKEREYLDVLNKNIEKLTIETNLFIKKYDENNTAIPKLEEKISKNNDAIITLINELKVHKQELIDNPILEKLMIEKRDIQIELTEIKKDITELKQPSFMDEGSYFDNMANWKSKKSELNLKEVDLTGKLEKANINVDNFKNNKKMEEKENGNGRKSPVCSEPRVKKNSRWRTSRDSMRGLCELNVVTNCEEQNLLHSNVSLYDNVENQLGRENERKDDGLQRLIPDTRLVETKDYFPPNRQNPDNDPDVEYKFMKADYKEKTGKKDAYVGIETKMAKVLLSQGHDPKVVVTVVKNNNDYLKLSTIYTKWVLRLCIKQVLHLSHWGEQQLQA